MVKESIKHPIEIIYQVVDETQRRNKPSDFFQLTYILEGEGLLNINGDSLPYRTGSLWLVTPNERHTLEVSVPTKCLLARFNEAYIRQYQWRSIRHIECLLYYAAHLSGCVMRSKTDGILVRKIIDSLLHLQEHKDLYDEDLTIHFVNTLIVIAARNISKIKPVNVKDNADKKILDIINYIQTNIYDPEKLRASVIAGRFGIAKNYLGSYFKSQCGEPILHYISNYKMRLIEHMLKFSDRRINEIVDEFGFADESHLNKFFKKHRGVSLSAYRKSVA